MNDITPELHRAIASAQTEHGGFAESHIVPGANDIILVLFQPGEHRVILPLSKSGADCVVKVLQSALKEVGE